MITNLRSNTSSTAPQSVNTFLEQHLHNGTLQSTLECTFNLKSGAYAIAKQCCSLIRSATGAQGVTLSAHTRHNVLHNAPNDSTRSVAITQATSNAAYQ